MRTYYIFNINKYFSFMYKNNPFKVYKIFEELYYIRSYDKIKTMGVFEEVTYPFNRVMLNEYFYFKYKFKYGYERVGNVHKLNSSENTTVTINNYNIKIVTDGNYSVFFRELFDYNKNLFVCDFENKDYFWLSKLYNNTDKKTAIKM